MSQGLMQDGIVVCNTRVQAKAHARNIPGNIMLSSAACKLHLSKPSLDINHSSSGCSRELARGQPVV
eukprot:CAMPEP_0119321178 /NCGR_PEP_ID=MMETSP1333-20130426/54673_1 /TAXON_ID=418940 /ORGANISM="Scyphosphaera apsteinii, Strain RCC1455" /LENGTH=66 /DNA_ID=CAMNT_0007328099 /DNA_START=469 /DNA_END=665 /DNA_ORIENTATION=-